jgi:hypothetical protein
MHQAHTPICHHTEASSQSSRGQIATPAPTVIRSEALIAVLPVAKQQYTLGKHRIGLGQRKQRPATVRAADHHELRKPFAADGFSEPDTDRFIARFSFSNQKTASEAVASVISSAR